MGDYQRLHTDAEAAEVPPVEPKIQNPFWHRTLLVLTISLTLAVIIFFVWGLPCDVEVCTPKQHTITWDRTLYGLELKGRMHLVGGHLISIFRSALWDANSTIFPPHTGGVNALSATTGQLIWYIPLHNTPIHIDCTILGNKRCLILGENGLLMAIDYVSGIQVWKMLSPNTTAWPQPVDIDFPLIVPQCKELITLSRFKPGQHRLLFINMDSGVISSEPLLENECAHVEKLTYSFNGTLHYTCTNQLIGSPVKSYPTEALGKCYKNIGKIPSEPIDYSRSINEDGIHCEQKMVVTNKGPCPQACQVSINVTSSSNATVWTYSAERTYAMDPLPLRFRPHITGFLIKLWQWHDQGLKSRKGHIIELIKERIVLITFNKSGFMHVVNASQTDITRLCNIESNECQPQLTFQTQSALLVDVNEDGRQDLISYYVTYRPVNEDEHNLERVKDWELQSRVRVVRLEAELPKLYDVVSKH